MSDFSNVAVTQCPRCDRRTRWCPDDACYVFVCPFCGYCPDDPEEDQDDDTDLYDEDEE